MKRQQYGWVVAFLTACSSAPMTMDAGVDSGVPMPTMVSATGMLTGMISAPKPIVGYDAAGNDSSFVLRATAAGPFKIDVFIGFGAAPTANNYTSSSAGFQCSTTVTSGTAAADTWVARFNNAAGANKGSCSLTFTQATVGASGYDVKGTFAITADTEGGASSGMVMLTGTF